VDAHWLVEGDPAQGLLALTLMALPALFILFSRRCRIWSKLLWVIGALLPWGFIALYVWVWMQRYADAPAESPTLDGAFGWWLLAYPWAVYLLYRATRGRFSGEKPRDPL